MFISRLMAACLGLVGLCSTQLAHAQSLWECGNGDTLLVTIYEAEDDPASGFLSGPAAPQVENESGIILACAKQGSGWGTEWVCSSVNEQLGDLRVNVVRGRRTGDPWALASVMRHNKVIAEGLPCKVDISD